MKLSFVAILGAAVAAVSGVVSAEVSSCLDGLVGGMHLESLPRWRA